VTIDDDAKGQPPPVNKPRIYEADLAKDFGPDPRNANKGTERGMGLLDKSIAELGAGRSIVADKNGLIPAGNKTREALARAGITKAVVIETDGRTPVVVKRMDFDLTRPGDPARRYAYMDNRVAELDLEWDNSILAEDAANGVDLSGLWTDAELKMLLDTTEPASLADRFLVPPFSVLDARQGYWQERKAAWLVIGIASAEGRGENLQKSGNGMMAESMRSNTGRLTYAQGSDKDPVSAKIADAGGTSIFDPVLCELVYAPGVVGLRPVRRRVGPRHRRRPLRPSLHRDRPPTRAGRRQRKAARHGPWRVTDAIRSRPRTGRRPRPGGADAGPPSRRHLGEAR